MQQKRKPGHNAAQRAPSGRAKKNRLRKGIEKEAEKRFQRQTLELYNGNLSVLEDE